MAPEGKFKKYYAYCTGIIIILQPLWYIRTEKTTDNRVITKHGDRIKAYRPYLQ